MKQILLGKVVLGFPKPLEYTDLFFLPALWPSSLQWKEPNVMLSPDIFLDGMV